jgi:hypothetical protein
MRKGSFAGARERECRHLRSQATGEMTVFNYHRIGNRRSAGVEL